MAGLDPIVKKELLHVVADGLFESRAAAWAAARVVLSLFS
jgi:hypothetical protein